MKTSEEIAEEMVDEYMLCSRDSLLYKEEIISPIATAIQAERDRAAVLVKPVRELTNMIANGKAVIERIDKDQDKQKWIHDLYSEICDALATYQKAEAQND
jgi:hypothetical protein